MKTHSGKIWRNFTQWRHNYLILFAASFATFFRFCFILWLATSLMEFTLGPIGSNCAGIFSLILPAGFIISELIPLSTVPGKSRSPQIWFSSRAQRIIRIGLEHLFFQIFYFFLCHTRLVLMVNKLCELLPEGIDLTDLFASDDFLLSYLLSAITAECHSSL